MKDFSQFPYALEVSFEPFVGYLQMKADEGCLLSQTLLKVSEADSLTWEIAASYLLSPLPTDDAYRGLFKPLNMEPLFLTPSMQKVFHWKKIEGFDNKRHLNSMPFLVQAIMMIVKELYGAAGVENGALGNVKPVAWFEDPEGFSYAMQLEIDVRFCRVLVDRREEFLVPGYREEILSALNNPERLLQLLPVDRFTFQGFVVNTATNITHQALLGEFQYQLIDQSSLIRGGRFDEIQEILQNMLCKRSLHMKLMVYIGSELFLVNSHSEGPLSCIDQDDEPMIAQLFNQSLFRTRIAEGKPYLTIRDQGSTHSPEEAAGWAQAPLEASSLLVIPLKEGEQVIGAVFLSSLGKDLLNLRDVHLLGDVWPILALATRGAKEEFEHEVESIIRKEFTSIHPSVEWKFRQAASQVIFDRQRGLENRVLGVEFSEVYPLFALSDVRSSSLLRAEAIVDDLTTQLELASSVLAQAFKEKPLPILEEIQFRLEGQKKLLADGLNTGDESSVVQFLQNEVEPLLEELELYGHGSQVAVSEYRGALHPVMKMVYRERGDLDESIRRINDTLGELVETSQVDAQAMYPHYFDKTSTDGVDQTLYLGPGMSPKRTWKRLYLQNLRLWQFLVLARGAQKCLEMKSHLPVPLDMTHLIMVQDMPLSIHFRMDEKRFGVEGAYNIRYELIKKRIDKATVKDSEQRLTQPGQIAVVYSRAEEAREYGRYIQFLTARGYLEPGVEELDLEDLQGVHGLKALRVRVSLSPLAPGKTLWEEVQEGLGFEGSHEFRREKVL